MSDAPPSYSSVIDHASGTHTDSSGHLQPHPVAHHGSIPPQARRSMEDEHRELPPGWIRRYDEGSQHQFFVDTEAKPPRSIWHHPYDDDQYLRTLSSDQRERLQHQHAAPNHLDSDTAEDTDEEDHHAKGKGAAFSSTKPSKPAKKSLGQKMKDKLTGSTHEERERERQQRDEAERKAYERHIFLRQAMSKAIQTGQPQLIGKDKQERALYLEPPQGGGGGGWGGSGNYHQDPNARYVRPDYGYSRPGGMYRGGGMYPMGMNPMMMGMGMGGMGLGMGMGMGMGGFGGGDFGGGGGGDGGGGGGC